MTLLLPGSASLSFLTQPPVDFSRKRRKDVEAVDGKGRAALEVQWSLALNDIPLDALHEAMDDVSEVQVVHRRALSGLPRPLTLCSSLCRLVCMTVGQSLRLVLLFEEVVHVKPLLVLEISGPVIQTGLEEEEDVQSGESFPFRILVLCEQRMNVYMCSLLDVESSVRVTCSLARTLTWCACGSRFAPLPSVSSPFVVIAGGHLHVWPPVVRDDAAPATLPTSPIPLTLPDADTTLTLLSCGFGSQPNVLFVTDNQRLMCIRANRVESSAIRVLLTVPTDLPSDHLFESERIIDMAISTKRVQGNVADLIAVSTTSRLLLYDTLSGFRAPLCVWNHMPSLTLLHWCVASPRPDPLNVLLASCGSGEEPMLLIAFTTQATPSDVVSGPSRARLSVAVHTESPLPLLMVPPQLPYWSFSDGALLFPCLTRSRIVAAVASWSTGELSYSELDGLSDGECTVVECPHVPPTELTVPSGGHAAPLVDWEGLATSLTSSLYQGISDSSLPLPVALPAITAVSAARNDIAVGSSTHFRVGPPVRVHAPTGWHTPGLLMDAGTFGGSLPHRKVTGKAPKPELRAPLFTAAPYLEVLDLSPAFVGAGDALAELAGVDCGEVDVEHPAFHESELLVWMPAVMDALTTPHTL